MSLCRVPLFQSLGFLVWFVLTWSSYNNVTRLAQAGSSCFRLWSVGLQVCTPGLANCFVKKQTIIPKYHMALSWAFSAWPPESWASSLPP